MIGKKSLLMLAVMFLFACLVVRPALAEEKVVHFLVIGPATGPGAAMFLGTPRALEDYFEELNAKGGVDGVKMKVLFLDDRYDVARGMSIYQRYRKTPRLSIMYIGNTGLVKGLVPLLDQDHHAAFTSGAGFAQAKIGRIFANGPVYPDMFGGAIDWMVTDWQKKGNPAKPIVGYLGWVGAFGKQGLNGGQQYAEKIGVKLLPPEFFPPGSLKHETWLERLARQGANYLLVNGVDPAQTNVIRDAYAIGLTAKIQMVSEAWGLGETLGLKGHPKELEGSVLISPWLRGEERLRHPVAKSLWTKHQKAPLEDLEWSYLQGVSMAMCTEAALKIALKEVGYDKIGGDAMIKALEQLTGKDVNQGAGGLCAYSPTSRLGSRQVKSYQVKRGNLVPITGWVDTPDCVSLGEF